MGMDERLAIHMKLLKKASSGQHLVPGMQRRNFEAVIALLP
jgi:hypothetical protein